MDTSGVKEVTRRVIQDVLERIEAARPEDAERIRRLVRAVVSLTEEQKADGTMGQWIPDPDPQCLLERGVDLPGTALIDDDSQGLICNLAHEFGHSCVTDDDLREQQFPDGEWCGECAANRYVHLWGFHKELEAFWVDADRHHHGWPPGTSLDFMGDSYIVTDDYRIISESVSLR